MPRMIDDELFDAIANDLKHCEHGESNFLGEFLKAPSVEMLDLGKVEWYNLSPNGFCKDGKIMKEEWVRVSDLQSLVVPSRWIAVTERLPEDDASYLTVDKKWNIQKIGFYDSSISAWLSPRYGRLQNVTHWQPLPQPPKEPQ